MRKKKPHLFVALGVLMMIVGTVAMGTCIFGGRLSPGESFALPFGFVTVAVGAMLLTRSAISVFFLFLYAITILVINIVHGDFLNPLPVSCLILLGLCFPLAKNARK
ncbi:MAG: hypothetical protein H7A51_12895 [Akkermansiaceae bacterium]|nr:hypothetical protein [Akkermansiaceae bacterium]